MRKLIITVLVLSLGFILPSYAEVGVILEGQQTPEKNEEINNITEKIKITVRRVENYAVSIVVESALGFGTCSGVIIKNTKSESIVLTAKHCVNYQEELYVEGILFNKETDEVKTSFSDDIAYIKINREIPNKMAVFISEVEPKRDDLVIVFGYPKLSPYSGVGTINTKTLDWQYASINIISGCSGAGAYNENGELIGIVWGSIGNPDKEEVGIGIFERYRDVVKFVKDNNLL